MSWSLRFGAVLAGALLVAGCHNSSSGSSGASSSSSSSSSSSAAAPTGTARGQLTSTPTQSGSYSPSDLESQLTSDPLGEELLQLTFSPTCTVTVYHIEYNTIGGANEATTASGAVMIPSGSDAACTGARPVVMYAHGTNTSKSFNMAALSGNSEALLMAAVFASQGYIVVAPNYAGYDTSTLPYHPYLNGAQQSGDMIDALAAARSAFASWSATASAKLFVTGYSQGGYVAMATQKAMEAAGSTVTAAAPMSGPYALAAFGDAIFEGEVNTSGPANLNLVITSYQHSYANIYTAPTDIYEAAYANTADELLPSATAISTLYSSNELTQNVLFSSTPPSPTYASMTPATTPASLASVFAQGFGTPDLINNTYRLGYLTDATANPDGGFPATTTGVPAAAPGVGLRQDLKTNDLRNWSPVAPVLLCGGDGDPTVFYFNTQLMQNYWASAAPSASLTVLDVDSAVTSGDPYASEKNGFAAAKATVAATGGSSAVLSDYHATLVPPFCVFAVKSFFDGH